MPHQRCYGLAADAALNLQLVHHRIDWSVQVPARRAVERDDAAIAA
jgi:winged helix-turn-helix protein